MTGKLLCSLFGHRVDRNRVRIRDYETYVGKCRRCSTRLVRTDGAWVAEDELD